MSAATGASVLVYCFYIVRAGHVSNWIFAAAVLVSLLLMVGYAMVIFWPEMKAWAAGCLKRRHRTE